MKRLVAVSMVCLLLSLISFAGAAVKYLSLEELKSTEGPATVRVIAKTDQATGLSSGQLTGRTRWRWLIRDAAGSFAPADLFVDMDQYRAMSLSERGFVLNHQECDLTVKIAKSGTWTAKRLTGVSKPLSGDDIVPILLAVLGIAGLFALAVYFISRQDRAGSRSSDKYITKIRVVAVNGVEYVTHKGALSNALIGHMFAGDIGAYLGAVSTRQVHRDNEITFLVDYGGGKKGRKKEIEKVRQSSKRFRALVAKLKELRA